MHYITVTLWWTCCVRDHWNLFFLTKFCTLWPASHLSALNFLCFFLGSSWRHRDGTKVKSHDLGSLGDHCLYLSRIHMDFKIYLFFMIFVFKTQRHSFFHPLTHSSIAHNTQDWARLKLRVQNSTMVFHMEGRDPSTWVKICCHPGCALERSWNWKELWTQTRHSDTGCGNLKWCLSHWSNAHPWHEFFLFVFFNTVDYMVYLITKDSNLLSTY